MKRIKELGVWSILQLLSGTFTVHRRIVYRLDSLGTDSPETPYPLHSPKFTE
jgi:hypothetical protein